MVSSGPNSLYVQLPWLHYLFLFASFISAVTVFSTCLWMCRCKGEPKDDDCDVENVEFDKTTERKTSKWQKNESSLHHSGGRKISNWSAPTTSQHVQPPQRQQTPLMNTNILLQEIEIQPAYKDYMAHESIRSGTVVLPIVIPEAPEKRQEDDLGVLYFSISYDAFTKLLKVHIKRAERLPAKDISGTSDPYVKMMLLPDKNQKLVTRIRKKKLNPIWNEVCTFEGFPYDTLLKSSVYLQVLDHDTLSKDDPIGEVVLPLAEFPLEKQPREFIKDLLPSEHTYCHGGDLLVAMCYKPSDNRLTIIIMKGNKLTPMNMTGKGDPYVKVCLVVSGKKLAKKKTTVKDNTHDPVWNEVMEFEVPFDKNWRDSQCVFTVMDFNSCLPNKMIGKISIGPHQGSSHWHDVMNSPRKSIAMWHTLSTH